MKTFTKRSVSIFLALLMIFSVVTPLHTTKTEAAGGNPVMNIVTGALKTVGGRAVKELSAYSISNDVPVLGNVFYLMCDPSQRAALKNSASIAEILSTVQAIEQDIQAMDAKLDEISKKQDQNQAELLFISASGNVNDIRDKYTTAWNYYESVMTYMQQFADYSALAENATDETVKANYTAQANSAFALAEGQMSLFINSIDLNASISFENDLDTLNNYVWKANGTSTTYLGTLEGYLRQLYAFEHQITEQMYTGFQVTENMQLQIFTMFKEYITYKRGNDPTTYALYTNEYFEERYSKLIDNLNSQAENSGISDFMIPDPFTDEELTDMFGTTNVDDLPEHIQTSVSIDGTTYDAYKVRENTTLAYYVILTHAFTGKEIVSKIYSEATNAIDTGKDIYRPVFMLDGLYTDDGNYKMISSVEELPFATTWTNLLSSLRDAGSCNLANIPQTITHLLLYSDNFVSNNLKDSYWNLTLQNVSDLSADASTVSSATLYGSSSYVPFVIYKGTATPDKYSNNNTYVANDKGLIENRTIVVSDGQTLDISDITVDVSNVTIIISGTGTVISNPNITLKDSQVIITNTEHGDAVYITNLNVKAKDYQEAALTIKTPCTVGFEGTNSFTGTSSEVSRADIYKHYVKDRPSFASHGILVDNLVTLAGVKDGTISYGDLQKLTAKGAGGGAGICLNYYNLTIKCLNVTANGSQTSFDDEITGSGENPYSIGAGIGASVGCIIKSSGSFSVKTDHTIASKGDSTINGANYLSIENSNVFASGIKSSRKITISDSCLGDEIYSEDIGGVKIPDTGSYYCIRAGVFSDSTIATSSQRISSRITTKNNNNIYNPEIFKITTYTKGSNGVTTDGVYFKLNGEKGSTDWMLASGCGNDKGNWSGNVNGISVGKITSVEVKTKSSNHWYPGKITVTGTFGGESITVYGGRWIGNSGTKLSPNDNIYKVTVNTGSESNSGTDSDIYLYLQDNDGTQTNNIELSDIHQDKNAFENGDSDEFWIYAPDDFGECRHAFFYSDHSNAAAGWLLDSFVIEKVQGKTADSGYTFHSGQWFEEERTINFGKYSGKTGAFYVEVKTQDSSGAGTDSNIYLTIYGDKGNTGEINLGTYAGSGNNFEKNDLDCFHIGYNKNAIGTINKIVIRKDNSGSGPDWKASYITVTEEVADGQTGQSVKFNINREIEDETVTITNKTVLRQTVSRIDTELLSSLQKENDGSYKLTVDRTVTVSEEVFDFIMEKDLKFTVEMQDEGKSIYSVTFDGSKIVYYEDITLHKGYSFADGYAMLDFISNATIPEGTTIKLFLKNLGFTGNDKLAVFSKDENNQWEEKINLLTGEEISEISLEEGKQLLINLFGTELPSETEPDENDNPGTGDCSSVQMWSLVLFMAVIVLSVSMKKTRRYGK